MRCGRGHGALHMGWRRTHWGLPERMTTRSSIRHLPVNLNEREKDIRFHIKREKTFQT